MKSIYVANCLSGIGVGLLAYSTFSKEKDKMLKLQVGDCIFNALAGLFVGSFSAMSTNLICALRNYINVKNKMSQKLSYVFAAIIFTVGILINTRGAIGAIPPLASVEYTICSTKSKNAQSLRFALLLNLCMWLVHDFYVQLYPAALTDILVVITTLTNIIICKRGDNYGEY